MCDTCPGFEVFGYRVFLSVSCTPRFCKNVPDAEAPVSYSINLVDLSQGSYSVFEEAYPHPYELM